MLLARIALILVGLFTIAGAVFNWDWFMGHWKARLFVHLFGRNGARCFYGILGLVIVVLGGSWVG